MTWRRLAPWLPLAAAIVMGAAGLWLEALDPRGANPTDPIVVPLLLTYGVAAGLIGSREPRNSVGWLLGLLCLAMVGSFFVGRYAIVAADHGLRTPGPQIAAALAWTWIVALSCPVLLAFVVPTGRPSSAPWRRTLVIVAATLAVVTVIFALGDPGGTTGSTGVDFPNPIYVPLLRPAYDFINAAFVIYVALFGAGAAALVSRFRRSRGVERQQLKWILFGIVAMLGGISASNLLPGVVSDVAFVLGMLPLPVSLAVAIGRHRLYDIDLVIKRTISYGALSLLLVAIEVGGILVLQELLSGVTGGQTYAVAGTTLAVAALFQPARRRIQAWVDRRFDRAGYDAARVVDGFGLRLRDRLDLRDVEAELVAATDLTLRPKSASVWLRRSEKGS